VFKDLKGGLADNFLSLKGYPYRALINWRETLIGASRPPFLCGVKVTVFPSATNETNEAC
jgi:hypothetical protein